MRNIGALSILAILAYSNSALANDKHIVVIAHNSQTEKSEYTYVIPSKSVTHCSTGMATDGSGTIATNCQTTNVAPIENAIVSFRNSAEVTDVSNGDIYYIYCTASWAGSKCSSFEEGAQLEAKIKGSNMWVTGIQGVKKKTAKYHISKFIPMAK